LLELSRLKVVGAQLKRKKEKRYHLLNIKLVVENVLFIFWANFMPQSLERKKRDFAIIKSNWFLYASIRHLQLVII